MMAYELDHLFIMTAVGGPAGDTLNAFGFVEGTPNVHRGQGTANRRWFFDNAMLELIWVADAAEAGNDLTRPTYLLDRWQGREAGASPFGVCLRPADEDVGRAPFPAWYYRPLYLPQGHVIEVADNAANIAEPFLFYAPALLRSAMASDTQARNHSNGLRNITGMKIAAPGAADLSAAMQSAVDLGIVTVERGERQQLTVEFDGGAQGQQRDFSPEIPLTVVW